MVKITLFAQAINKLLKKNIKKVYCCPLKTLNNALVGLHKPLQRTLEEDEY